MKRAEELRVNNNLNVQIFLDDLESMIRLLEQGGRSVEIDIDGWVLDGPHELAGYAANHATAEKMTLKSISKTQARGDWIMMTVKEGWAYTTLDPETPENRGILAQLSDLLDHAKVPEAVEGRLLWLSKPWDTIVLSKRPTKVRIAGEDTPTLHRSAMPSPPNPTRPHEQQRLPESRRKAPWAVWALLCGVVVGLVLWWRVPLTFSPVDVALIGGMATFLIVLWFNPATWHRRRVTAVTTAWLLIRGGAGIATHFFAHTPYGRIGASVENTPLPWVFDIAVLILIFLFLRYDKYDRQEKGNTTQSL